MAEKVTISRIAHFDKDKSGNPLKSKMGKPYTRCMIELTDGRKVSGFGSAKTQGWSAGSEVEIEITPNGEYLNFSVPKVENINNETLLRIEKKVDSINWHIVEFTKAFKNKVPMYPSPEMEGIDPKKTFPDDIIDESEIPF